MIYPRITPDGKLIDEGQMVGGKEHLSSQHRFLSVSGTIGDEIDACNLLLAFDSMSHKPIKLSVHSPGGSVDSAFMFYDTFKQIKSPIYTWGRICCSAAVILLAGGQRGHRFLSPHSKVMLHLVSGTVSGNQEEIAIQNREMEDYQNKFIDVLRECGVKRVKKQIMGDIRKEFWLNAQEAIEYGLADKVMDKATLKEWFK